MGAIGKRGVKPEPYTEKEIQQYLWGHFMTPNGAKYQIENLFVYRWESDYLHVTKAGYSYEVEIKVTRSDFFNDVKKVEKHQILEGTYSLKRYEKQQPQRPNYFYYAVPKDMVKPEEMPSYAGLIYINRQVYPYVEIVVTAPKIHGDKIDEEALKLKDKFYYNYIDWKRKAETTYANKIKKLETLLSEAKTDENTGIKYKYTISEANEMIPFLDSQIKEKEKEVDRLYRENSQLWLEKRRLRAKLFNLGITGKEVTDIENGE